MDINIRGYLWTIPCGLATVFALLLILLSAGCIATKYDWRDSIDHAAGAACRELSNKSGYIECYQDVSAWLWDYHNAKGNIE